MPKNVPFRNRKIACKKSPLYYTEHTKRILYNERDGMIQKIKNRIREKFANTVFGNASSGIRYLYEKNEKFFFGQMIVVFLLTILISGRVSLFIMNMGGSGYLVNLRNILAAWINKGILLSLVIFLFLEWVFFRCVLLFKTGYKKDIDRNYDISSEGTYGTNTMMDETEMKTVFNLGAIEEIKDPVFGKNPYNTSEVVGQKHPLRKINRNVLMVAGPSAGKSATYIIPLILQILRKGESAIINDPKSELFKITSELAKMLGYEVRILNLNPMFLENSDPCNFMMYVGDDVDKAQVLSTAIIATTDYGEAMFDYWQDGALNLLQALILRITIGNDYKPEEKNLATLFHYIMQYDVEGLEADFSAIPTSHPAYAPFKIFADGDEKPKEQVLQGLRLKLKLFNSKKLRTILSATEGNIDFLNPGRKRCLYFVGSNDQDESMSPIVSLFFTLFYQELVRYADMRIDGELPITVHMVLDEAPSITIPKFEKKLSTVRSRNIVTHMACQDINQLKNRYPLEAWRTIMNDVDYFLMLKTNDPETMKWWSEMSGEQTINVKNKRYDRNKMDVLGIHARETVSEGQGTRQVFTAGEIRSIKEDEVLLLVSQHNIIKLKTFYWAADHPYGRFISKNKDKMYVLPAQHYPFWRLIRDGIVGKDFDYDHEPSYVLELEKDEKMQIDESYDPDAILKLKSKHKNSFGRTFVSKSGEIADNVKKKTKESISRKLNRPLPGETTEEPQREKVPVPKLNVIKKEEKEDADPITTKKGNGEEPLADIQQIQNKNASKKQILLPVPQDEDKHKNSNTERTSPEATNTPKPVSTHRASSASRDESSINGSPKEQKKQDYVDETHQTVPHAAESFDEFDVFPATEPDIPEEPEAAAAEAFDIFNGMQTLEDIISS